MQTVRPRYSSEATGSSDARQPRHVVPGQEAALGVDEAVDLLRDEALVPGTPRLLDLLLAGAAARLVEDPLVRRRERGVAKQHPDLRRRQVEVARARPGAQKLLCALDRGADPGYEREALLRVADRKREHVLEPPGTELLQQQQPAAERAGNAGREDAGARDELVSELAEALDRGGGRSDPLAAERDRLAAGDRPEQRRHLAARPVQVRLDDLKREADRNCRVEGVAAALEHGHPRRGAEPVCRADHPERASELGTGREAHRRYMIKQVVVPCASSLPAASVSFPSAVAMRDPLWSTVPSQRINPVSAVIGRTKLVFTSSVV